mmetsp:Transcript_37601/g.118724  ORF Transcript_37601/g.118724 Transcript_37601/m.118724 type:complete len:141 (-) Transcript_37601:2038-2460(-)
MLMRHQHQGWTPEAVFDMIRARRAVAAMRGLGGIKSQWHAVKRFQRYLRRQGGVLRTMARTEAPQQPPAQAWTVDVSSTGECEDASRAEERTPQESEDGEEARVLIGREEEGEKEAKAQEEEQIALPGAAGAAADSDENV